MRTLTAPDRLAQLLPWLNGEPLTDADIRQQLHAFLRSFDEATEHTGYLRIVGPVSARSVESETLERLRIALKATLQSGFWEDRLVGTDTIERTWEVRMRPHAYQLRFGTVRRRDETPYAEPSQNPSRRAKRQHAAPGAYELVVSGPVSDLVPYLAMHLLTAPGAASIGRCPAPAPNNWDARCHQFLLRTTQGHPREFCSEACRVRSHAERARKKQEVEAAAKRRRQRRRRA